MPREYDEPELDFGDPELNDPDYEEKVGNADAATTDTTADTVTQEPASTGTDASQSGSAPSAGGADAGSGGAGAQQGQQPTAPVGGTRSDDKGNLVDARGNIIAAAGAERRHYEKTQQQGRYIATLERDIAALRSGSEMAQALNGAPAQLGLSASETDLALQFVSSFKKDPVATARWALQETMRMGYNLQQIVGDAAPGQPLGGSMDLGAVKAMIAEAVQPLVGDRQAAQRNAQIATDAERDYNAFIAKHDNAAVHDDTLANMLRQDDTLTPETAYWQLVAYAARNGLDFAQPLRAQVLARQNGQAASNGHAQPPSAQRQMPMPNGSNPVGNMQQNDGMAAPDDSWDSIVQASLRSAGFN
jgi:hypothetical protein